jgi:hypothetical protein
MIEGIEVVFIVIATGAGNPHMPTAAALGAAAALLLVALLGVLLRHPVAMIPENALKFVVGVLLCAFGTFWVGEGVGLTWPGHDWALAVLTAAFLAAALSGDSRLGQRNDHALAVQVFDCLVNGRIEFDDAGECLMSQVVRLQIVPDDLNVVQFGRIFRQPFNGQPVCASGKGSPCKLADVDWPIILDQHDRLARSARNRAIKSVDLLEMRHEVAAALGRTGMHGQFVRHMIKRAQHCDFLGLSGSRHAQIGARFRPCSGEVGVGQRLALIAIKQDDVAGCGLLLAKPQTQADTVDLAGNLPPLQRVPRPPISKLFSATPWTVASG